MARKQSDYLAALLADDEAIETKSENPESLSPDMAPPSPVQAESRRNERLRGSTLLGRESALARVNSGEVRQVTQLLLDPARVRVWTGNARSYRHLTEHTCAELIDSIIAEGGQKVPAIVRRIEGDPDHDYEVIAGTRRHWTISWLRANSYPQMQFVAQVAQLDDEAAFRLADIENRARKDVSDLERARNYAQALHDHYGNHLTRMADRLKLSKGWLSKMLKVATLPDAVVEAFGSPAEVQMKPAYPLAQLLDDRAAAGAILREAAVISRLQEERNKAGDEPLPAAEVIRRLIAAPRDTARSGPIKVYRGIMDRPALTVRTVNRQGVTLQIHSGSGLDTKGMLELLADALIDLENEGRGVLR